MQSNAQTRERREATRTRYGFAVAIACILLAARPGRAEPSLDGIGEATNRPIRSGRHLFERETFGGNGRTCATCHLQATGTVSPADAQATFAKDPHAPLFLADGSDDGQGNGASRMLADATILVQVPLAPNVRLPSDPTARTVTLARGVPTVRNTPALDPVLMLDGREKDLMSQAMDAALGHAAATAPPSAAELERIARFERRLFSASYLRGLARGRTTLALPEGTTDAERRGRRFFEERSDPADQKVGRCAFCHSGPLLNETDEFITVPPFGRGGRFQNVLVSELNDAHNPVLDFEFTNPDGSTTLVRSPDPGRALITGDTSDVAQSLNAFKIPILRGVSRTAPYFHDNSAKTLEDVLAHYTKFFEIVFSGTLQLTDQDRQDIVAFLKLLD
jgi:cytochrome c peroxidase